MSAIQELIEDSGAAVIRVALVLLVVAGVAFVLYSANWKTIGGLDASSVWIYRVPILKGFLLTLGLTAVAAVFGMLSGTILAIMAQSPIAPLRWIVAGHVELRVVKDKAHPAPGLLKLKLDPKTLLIM